MKFRLYNLLIALLLISFCSVNLGYELEQCDEPISQQGIEDQCFSQQVPMVDSFGRTATFQVVYGASTIAKRNFTRRTLELGAVASNPVFASYYSHCGYVRSCDYPFDHLPQERVFCNLRKLRI